MSKVYFDMIGDHGVCNVDSVFPEMFGFRPATVDEIWQHRLDKQATDRTAHDPHISSPHPRAQHPAHIVP